jgi:hypothetical protein
MKKLTLLLCLLALFGCKKGLTVTFDISQDISFSIPPASVLPLGLSMLPPFAVQTNWSQTFANNKTAQNQLKTLYLKTMTLTITNPPSQTFNFVKSLDFYISSPNQSQTEFAWDDNIPSDVGSTLNMNCTDNDLSPYAKSEAFQLSAQYAQQKSTSDTIYITAHTVFSATAYLIK